MLTILFFLQVTIIFYFDRKYYYFKIMIFIIISNKKCQHICFLSNLHANEFYFKDFVNVS